MISELILIILKYTGGFIAASYGVYATLTDFRIEKNGKKILTNKGYFGIGLLVTSSVLALSADGFKDYTEHQNKIAANQAEAEKARAARENEEQIIQQLGIQSGDLTTALGVLRENSKTSERISTDLGTEVNTTKGVSNTLGSAVKSLNETSQTTNALLQETINRIDFYTVAISVSVDPIALNDKSGKSILSPKALQLLEDSRARKVGLSQDQEAAVTREVEQRSSLVRSTILKKWSTSFWLDDQKANSGVFNRYMDVSFNGEDGVSKVERDYMSDGVIYFTVSYAFPPNRFNGFRKYKDLNGARWFMALATDPDILRVDKIDLYVGSERGIASSKFLTLAASPKVFATSPPGLLKNKGLGIYSGEMIIPANYF